VLSQEDRPVSTQAPRRFRRLAGAVAAIALAASLAACGANVTAQTAVGYHPTDGTSADTGSIAIRSVLVVSGTAESGSLVMVLVNNGSAADSLTDVTVADAGRATISSGSITIPANSVVKVGLTSAVEIATGGTTPGPTVSVFGTGIVAGGATSVTLTFGNSPSVVVPVLVVPNTGDFKDIVLPSAAAKS
jgi:hypothetical protein